MKKLNNKGFAISTLIYGVLILFVLIMSVLIATLNFRYRSLSDITSRAEKKKGEYFLNIGITLDNDDEYIIPFSATYNFEYYVSGVTNTCSAYIIKNKVIDVEYLKNNECVDIEETVYIKSLKSKDKLINDNSGANIPDIRNGLVPVKYVTNEDDYGNWVITTVSDPDWYDYSKQKWANAVSLDLSTDEKKAKLLNEDGTYKVGTELTLPDGTSNDSDVLAMFVWIPRYSYTIGCGNDVTGDNIKDCLGYRIDRASDLQYKTISGSYPTYIPGAIDIKFVSNTDPIETGTANYDYNGEERNPDNYYTHPAFWWDENGDRERPEDNSEELSGIWVGKFETGVSEGSSCYDNLNNFISNSNAVNSCNAESTTPKILPNIISLRLQNISNQFKTAHKFTENNNIYGLRTDIDSHMMKNSEWSAVAYLSQSKYGKYGNENYSENYKEIYKNNSGFLNDTVKWSLYTGRSSGMPSSTGDSKEGTYKYDVEINGTGASTTGNIYGIYDMIGGGRERVMTNYSKNNTFSVSNSGFSATDINDADFNKYFDYFDEDNNLGMAINETINWYSDLNRIDKINTSAPFITRGGYYENGITAGLFYFYESNGSASRLESFRVTLVN